MRGYHFRKTGKGRVVRRVPRPRSVRAGLALGWALDWDWRVELLDARRIEAVLRKRRFTFCDVQLLPEVAASRGEALEGFVRAGVGESSGGVRVSIDRICGDAEPCASVDERAKERDTVDGAATLEATGFEKDAKPEESHRWKTNGIYVW